MQQGGATRQLGRASARPLRRPDTRTDLALAYLHGPRAWLDGASRRSTATLSALAASLMGLIGTGITIVVVLASTGSTTGARRVLLIFISVLALAILAVTLVAKHRDRISHPLTQTVFRILSITGLAAVWIAYVSPSQAALAWPFGLYIGGEASCVAHVIGLRKRRRSYLVTYLSSPIHLGLLSGTLALVLTRSTGGSLVATSLITVEAVGLMAILVFAGFSTLLLRGDAEMDSVERRIHETEARRRAHWIHDDVCSDLRQIRVRLATIPMELPQVVSELDDLDDRLRLRQLDEVIAGGGVTAAEVLQVYVRKAQALGLTITDVPHFEEASTVLRGDDAHLFKRCVAGFMSNALQAGATQVGLTVARNPGELLLTVSDNAGGFDIDCIPAGRGLSVLRSQLGDDNLTAARTDDGVRMNARIKLRCS